MAGFKGVATQLFGSIVDKYADLFSIVKNSLPRASIKISFRTYMSIVLFTATITYITSLIATIVALQIIQVALLLMVAYIVFVPFLIALSVFIVFTFYPLQKSASRKKDIDLNLPFALTHMGAIAESGVPPYVIFKLIADVEEYGELAREMKKVVRNIDTFGINPLTAVREVAKRTPSEDLKQILLGYVSAVESGGDIKLFLKNAGQQALFEYRIKRERFLQQLSAYAEFYTGILIAAPLFIIALFSIMNMIQPTIAGYDILFLTKMSIYLVIPLINIGFLLFLRGTEMEM